MTGRSCACELLIAVPRAWKFCRLLLLLALRSPVMKTMFYNT